MSRNALIAANRFGLGADMDDLRAIGTDPTGWLKSQFDAEHSSILPEMGLPSVEDALSSHYLLPKSEKRERKKELRQKTREVYELEVAARTRAAITGRSPRAY